VTAGDKIEVLQFENAGPNAERVVTKSVDFGAFASPQRCSALRRRNRSWSCSTATAAMAIIAKKERRDCPIKDLKGKGVAVFQGTTQESVSLERL